MAEETAIDGSVGTFRELYNAIARLYDDYAKACGLSPAAFWCLVSVSLGTTSQADIAAENSISRQTVNTAFRLLKEKGLIELVPDPQNGRVKHARLTERGERFSAEHLDRLDRIDTEAWGGIPEAARIQANRVLATYMQSMNRALRE